MLLRYGKHKAKEKFDIKNSKCTISLVNLIKKYGEIDGKIRWDNYIKNKKENEGTIDSYIKRHGEIEGTRLWNEYVSKRHETYQKNKQSGKYKDRGSLEWWIKIKNSVEEGTKSFNEVLERLQYVRSKQYYIDIYGEIEGEILCRKNKDHSSYDYFLSKFKEPEIALRHYNKSCENLKNYSVSEKNLIKKYGEIDGKIRWKEYLKKVGDGVYQSLKNKKYSNVSKVELEFFNLLLEDKDYKSLCFYGENQFKIENDGIGYWPDLLFNNKIIEFNGDIFHANPKFFKPNDRPNPFCKSKTAQDIWNKEKIRLDFIKNLGYDILIIWEYDYRTNLNECIIKARKFLES
jgi:hypothetical protein